MPKDFRLSFLDEVETALANTFSPEDISIISNVVVKALSNYELSERCTALALQDNSNENLIRRFRACLMVEGRSNGTITQYTLTIRKLSETLQKPFTEMGVYDIRLFLALEQERGLSARTRENERANLSAFFTWMMNDEIIRKNPMAKIKPTKYKKEVRQAFSDVELDALRGACRTLKERAIFEFLLSTGVRVSELTSMKVEDIDFDKLSVHVVHGKGNKERMTYTTAVSAKHLIKYLNSRKECGELLFYNLCHEPLKPGGVRRTLKFIAERANVKNVHPHRFRRTFATMLAKRGMEVQEIQQLLGHSGLDTTMQYIVTDDTQVRASYNKYIA